MHIEPRLLVPPVVWWLYSTLLAAIQIPCKSDVRGEKDKARITGLIIESVFKPFVILNHFGFITHPELGTATRGHLESAESLIERVYNGFDDHQ